MVVLLFAVSLVTLMAFVALAIDLGMMALARTQFSDAADAAAHWPARGRSTATRPSTTTTPASTPTAQQAVCAQFRAGRPLTASQLSVNIGRYIYVSANQQFEGQFPGPSTQNWNMVQATVSPRAPSNLHGFSKIFELSCPTCRPWPPRRTGPATSA